MPSSRANDGSVGSPICAEVSVTISSGTSLIPPSNSRNRTTRPVTTHPVKRTPFVFGIVVMVLPSGREMSNG